MPAVTSVATFVSPLNQFEAGESVDECVAYGVADIYYSGPPNGQPTGSAEEVDQLADLWYGKLEGGYSSSNTNGMSLQAEYDMLTGLGMKYTPLPSNVASIISYLESSFNPVLICGSEGGFFDVALNRVPYNWDYSQYNHCIVVCGVTSSGNLLVRDYANVVAEPGSVREYKASTMSLISATGVEPLWKSTPPPAPAAAFVAEANLCWQSVFKQLGETPPPTGTGIYKVWMDAWSGNAHRQYGPALTWEYASTNAGGEPLTIQEFAHARIEWKPSNSTYEVYDARGLVDSGQG